MDPKGEYGPVGQPAGENQSWFTRKKILVILCIVGLGLLAVVGVTVALVLNRTPENETSSEGNKPRPNSPGITGGDRPPPTKYLGSTGGKASMQYPHRIVPHRTLTLPSITGWFTTGNPSDGWLPRKTPGNPSDGSLPTKTMVNPSDGWLPSEGEETVTGPGWLD